LTLTAGEPVAALTDDRVETIGQGVDDASQLRACECVPHLLLGRVGVDEGEIRTDGLMEDMTVLGDDADSLAQIGERQIPDIDSTDADRAAGDIVEARSEEHTSEL